MASSKQGNINHQKNQKNSNLHMTDSATNPNIDSNLSKEEQLGLKSIRERIKSGQIIVADTDKTKKFALLTPEQYIESGNVHTDKDIRIEPDKVKRIQNYVNDHVWWLKESSQLSSNWSHEGRMARNVCDKGEQVCQMTLLIKDHKKWQEDSGKPIPSRPVVSGNSGLNCHLSELISLVIEPISFEHNGNEIDSTDDLIAKLNIINEKKSLNQKIYEYKKDG